MDDLEALLELAPDIRVTGEEPVQGPAPLSPIAADDREDAPVAGRGAAPGGLELLGGIRTGVVDPSVRPRAAGRKSDYRERQSCGSRVPVRHWSPPSPLPV